MSNINIYYSRFIFSWDFQPKLNDLSNFTLSSAFKFNHDPKNNFGPKIKKTSP